MLALYGEEVDNIVFNVNEKAPTMETESVFPEIKPATECANTEDVKVEQMQVRVNFTYLLKHI